MLDSGSTMELVQLVFGIIVILLVKYLIAKFCLERKRISKLSKEELKYDNVRTIYKKLKNGISPKAKVIAKNANDIEKRLATSQM